jgi:prepilin-type N-terminal cleavage/methylation domain-containing protein
MNIPSVTRKNKSKRGFTLVEIITVVVLLGIFAGIGLTLMKDTASVGRAAAVKQSADALNDLLINAKAAGATISQGGYAFTNGTANSAATITIPNGTPVAQTAVDSLLTQFEAGIISYGITTQLAKSVTKSSYELNWTNGATNPPVFTGKLNVAP